MKAAKTLDDLRRERPEWSAWLALLGEVRAAAASPAWREVAVELAPARSPDTPVLDGATLRMDAGAADRLVRRLFAIAITGTSSVSSRRDGARAATALVGELDVLAFIASGLAGDTGQREVRADGVPFDVATLAALAHLAAVPAAHACARAHRESMTTWTAPYCPVCGRWPAFAEERGLERSRRYRCGTCATDWWAAWLTCPFCGESEHEQLGSLTLEDDSTRRVDVCQRCKGYVKTMTVLGAAPDVALLDADTVELDLAAHAQGYARPGTPGRRVTCHVAARPGLGRRLLAWTR